LTQVPANWDETRVLHAKMGECLVVARRQGNAWYLGGMTANQQQELSLPLDFLGDGSFEAEVYADHATGGPTSIDQRRQTVSASDKLQILMPRSGGFAARLDKTER
jgi:alpha-glucosidase